MKGCNPVLQDQTKILHSSQLTADKMLFSNALNSFDSLLSKLWFQISLVNVIFTLSVRHSLPDAIRVNKTVNRRKKINADVFADAK